MPNGDIPHVELANLGTLKLRRRSQRVLCPVITLNRTRIHEPCMPLDLNTTTPLDSMVLFGNLMASAGSAIAAQW